MEPREPRKRITYVPKGIPAIDDEIAFIKNKCSDHAVGESHFARDIG